MYWLIFSALVGFLIFLCVKLDAHPIVGLFIYLFITIGITIGTTALPKVFVVSPEGKVRKEFATMPWIRRSVQGAQFYPQLDSTYIVNGSGLSLIKSKVYYTPNEALVGTPVKSFESDTLKNTLLRFASKRVAPFVEANPEMKTFPINPDTEVVVDVISLTTQDLNSSSEQCYRLLREEDMDDTVYL